MTQDRLKELLHYDSDTGLLKWLEPKQGRRMDKAVGSKNSIGYMTITIDYKRYYTHRLAWLYVYGSFPNDQIDHINRVRDDNRICNLRDVTNQENHFNETSKGYHYNKRERKYTAQIGIEGKKIHLGCYNTKEEAVRAYLIAKERLHIIKEWYDKAGTSGGD